MKEAFNKAKDSTTGFVSKHKAPLSLILGTAIGVGGSVAYKAYKDRKENRVNGNSSQPQGQAQAS